MFFSDFIVSAATITISLSLSRGMTRDEFLVDKIGNMCSLILPTKCVTAYILEM